MRGRGFVVVALVAVLAVVVGGLAAYWFLIRSDPPPEATVVCGVEVEPTEDPGLPGGDWVVEPADDVFAGYRVQERFGGDTLEQTAVGRSTAVDGTLTVDGDEVTDVDVIVDVTQLTSEESRRDRYLRTNGLETDAFPEARFVLTDPIDLPTTELGREVTVDAVGDLTMHGVTRAVTVPIEACWDGEAIDLAGSVPVTFDDFEVTPPDIAGFVTVEDEGVLELQLRFVPAG